MICNKLCLRVLLRFLLRFQSQLSTLLYSSLSICIGHMISNTAQHSDAVHWIRFLPALTMNPSAKLEHYGPFCEPSPQWPLDLLVAQKTTFASKLPSLRSMTEKSVKRESRIFQSILGYLCSVMYCFTMILPSVHSKLS